jgi:hypothetical protein
MDKSTPDGPNASNSPWPEDSGSAEGFGATGIFGTVKAPEPVKGSAGDSEAETEVQNYRAPEAAKPQSAPIAKPFAEPVVHKVVLGGGAGADTSPELLDRMRKAAAERAPIAENAPATQPGGKGSGGFTELLRTLESDSPALATGASGPPAPETPRPAQDSGFTSLLRTLSTPQVEATPAEAPMKTAHPSVQSIPAEPAKAPAASGAGGFTELLRATSMEGEEPRGQAMSRPALSESHVAGGAAGATPTPGENQPGTFTQLFGTFGGAGSSPPAPIDQGLPVPPPASAGSFTKMLSLEQQSAPAVPPFREELKPSARSMDFGLTPAPERPAAASADPFSPAPMPEAQPIESAPAGGGSGITRLIQMLDEPSSAPAPRMDVAPVSSSPGTEPGVWTQTFASLATPGQPAAPAAKAPDWSPAQAPPGRFESPVSREAGLQAGMNQPAASAPAAAPARSGPSEFTRILDASRIRELAMRGGQAVVGGSASATPTPQSFAPPPIPPPVPMPSYQPPAAPQMGGMHGMGGMPQPGGYAPPQPPQPPGYPMSYGPQAGGMPAPGANMPLGPGMYAPAPPPMPSAPTLSPVKPAEPGMGKLQQYVPLLLVLVIVLLFVLLVTVVFLLKH